MSEKELNMGQIVAAFSESLNFNLLEQINGNKGSWIFYTT